MPESIITRTCAHCGNDFRWRASKDGKGLYCSKACFQDSRDNPAVMQARFWSKVEKSIDGCMLWTGGLESSGYGFFSIRGGGHVLAHRFAWEIHHGAPPPGKALVLDHLCRNHRCVNVAHLELVTFRENIIRGVGPTAVNAAKTECINGHPLSGDNVYDGHQGRHCKVCARERARAHYLKKRATPRR